MNYSLFVFLMIFQKSKKRDSLLHDKLKVLFKWFLPHRIFLQSVDIKNKFLARVFLQMLHGISDIVQFIIQFNHWSKCGLRGWKDENIKMERMKKISVIGWWNWMSAFSKHLSFVIKYSSHDVYKVTRIIRFKFSSHQILKTINKTLKYSRRSNVLKIDFQPELILKMVV